MSLFAIPELTTIPNLEEQCRNVLNDNWRLFQAMQVALASGNLYLSREHYANFQRNIENALRWWVDVCHFPWLLIGQHKLQEQEPFQNLDLLLISQFLHNSNHRAHNQLCRLSDSLLALFRQRTCTSKLCSYAFFASICGFSFRTYKHPRVKKYNTCWNYSKLYLLCKKSIRYLGILIKTSIWVGEAIGHYLRQRSIPQESVKGSYS